MLGRLNTHIAEHKKKILFFMVSSCLSLLVAGSTFSFGSLGPLMVLAAAAVGVLIMGVFLDPRTGVWGYISYCFVLGVLVKYFVGIPIGILLDGILLLTWGGILVNFKKIDFSRIKNEYILMSLVWFAISFLQVLNPDGGSVAGWFNEFRFAGLSWLLIAPFVFLLMSKKADLDRFILAIFAFSLLATVYGMKQLYLGLSSNEQVWMNAGNAGTHIINGKLRVFSMYSDAGQFGASQAIMAVIALTLAAGPFSWLKKISLTLLALVFLYGMAISGTRGALFALASGLFSALFLSRNFKLLIAGLLCCGAGFGLLKYTMIGEDIFQVSRLRSALNPKDASLGVRLENQRTLKRLLEDLPFGAGLGMSGANGTNYNSDRPIANIPPDSYWVKVWVMYGVIGLVIWFAITSYIIGKCGGIAWKIRDPKLRVKMIALTSGTFACFICSYGNEVMNGMPSSVIMFMSWSFVFIAPELDEHLKTTKHDGTNI
ncbi:O-antigen ligase family protein [Pedobacter agri]|uniref:O-antigen ligase family protein n=1 Tax=Pedobacter agri TaxID=454586 RepID=A0A9X3DC26_9SPHI|nr:O-antigen ligase family protein [Pedobacter agri]MCX3264874.1 O-antigen ligase family protein [Pedobacter agri]